MGWRLSDWAAKAMEEEDLTEEELCNDRGLNYEDIYDDIDDDDDD